MSQERKKPPALKLTPFKPSSLNAFEHDLELDDFDRSLLSTDEATMITSLDQLQGRSSQAHSSSVNTQPSAPNPLRQPPPYSSTPAPHHSLHQGPNQSNHYSPPDQLHGQDLDDVLEEFTHQSENKNKSDTTFPESDLPQVPSFTPPPFKSVPPLIHTPQNPTQPELESPSYPSSSLTSSIPQTAPPLHPPSSTPTPSLGFDSIQDYPAQPHPSSTEAESSQVSLGPSEHPQSQSSTHPIKAHLVQNTLPLDGQSKLVLFFNTRGGVGATALACNMAGALQASSLPSVIVDMDLQMCNVPNYLNCKLERSLAEFIIELHDQKEESDLPRITSAVDFHASGLSVIAQDGRIGEITSITPDRLPLFYEALKRNYNYIIVDGFRSFSDHAVTVMDLADLIILPITQDVPSIRCAKRALSLFERLGYSRDKIKFVLNRNQKKALISIETIESVLGREVDFFISNHFPFVAQAISEGLMFNELNPAHKISKEVLNMSLTLAGRTDLIPKPKGLFGRIFGKKKKKA